MGNVFFRSTLRACRRLKKMTNILVTLKAVEDEEMEDCNDHFMPFTPLLEMQSDTDDDPMDNWSNVSPLPIFDLPITEDVVMDSDVDVQMKDESKDESIFCSYLCSKCGFQGCTIQEANGHKDECSYEWSMPFLCDRCGLRDYTLNEALTHFQVSQEFKDGFLCTVCGVASIECKLTCDHSQDSDSLTKSKVLSPTSSEESRKRKQDSYSEVDAKKRKLVKTINLANEENEEICATEDEIRQNRQVEKIKKDIGCQTDECLIEERRKVIQVESVALQTSEKIISTRETSIQTNQAETGDKQIQTDPEENLNSPYESNLKQDFFCVTFNRILSEAQQYFNNVSEDKSIENEFNPYSSLIDHRSSTAISPQITSIEIPPKSTSTPIDFHQQLINKLKQINPKQNSSPKLEETIPRKNEPNVDSSDQFLKTEQVDLIPTQLQILKEKDKPTKASPSLKKNSSEKVKRARGRPRKIQSLSQVDDDDFEISSSSSNLSGKGRKISEENLKTQDGASRYSRELMDASIFEEKKLKLLNFFDNSSDEDSLPEIKF